MPPLLERSLRAPSYRAIALCILKNDIRLVGLGMSVNDSKWYYELKKMHESMSGEQYNLL